MKPLLRWPVMLLGLFLAWAGNTQKANAQYDDVSLQSFYDELSPYGTWINDPEYGYVWRPDVDQQDFRPYYTNGRWAMTEYGNTWVSNYDWGWAPFHYGRWIYNRYNSWIWLPDTTWGPAWVDWRSGGGYYGWAPMAPTVGVHIRIGGYRRPDFCWNFIPQANIYINTFPRYTAYRSNNVYIQRTVVINNTYVRNNRTYYTGPRVDEVRRATNRNVTVYNINRVDRRGDARMVNNRVNVYTPPPSRSAGNAAPQRSVSASVRTQKVDRNNQVTDRPSRGSSNYGTSQTTTDNGRTNNGRGRFDGNRDNANNGENGRASRTFDRGNTSRNDNTDNERPTRTFDRNNANQRQSQSQNRGVERQRMEAPPQRREMPRRMERSNESRGNTERGGGARVERRSGGNQTYGAGRSNRGGRG